MHRNFVFLILIMIALFSVSSLSYAGDNADNVVAKVNGTIFLQKDLELEVDRLIPKMTFHRNVPLEKRKLYYDQAMEALIDRELQYQDAVAKGMKPDKEKVDAEMEKIRKRFKSPDEYKAALEKDGLSEEKLRAQIEKEMLVQNVIAKTVTEPSKAGDAELKEFYDKNTSKFKHPESVKLRLISTKDEKKAKDILDKLKAGEDFGDLAYKMSEDSYRVKGGDIGYMHKGRMLPEIEDAAFKMKVGELSDLIKAEDTWFIIKVEDKKPEQQMSFEESKGKLKKELEDKRANELREKWIAGLKAKAKIEVLLKKE